MSDASQYQDRDIVCCDCNDSFTFSADEQKFYAEKGLDHPPKRCRPCRTARKSGRSQGGGSRRPRFAPVDNPPLFKADLGDDRAHRAEQERKFRGAGRGRQGGSGRGGGATRDRYDAVCSACNTPTQVPFKPNGVQPVYCRTCLPEHRKRRA